MLFSPGSLTPYFYICSQIVSVTKNFCLLIIRTFYSFLGRIEVIIICFWDCLTFIFSKIVLTSAWFLVTSFGFLGPKRWIGTNLKGILYPQDTTFNTQLLLQTFLQFWLQSLSLPLKGSLSKVGTELTRNPKVVSNSRAGAVKKDESQASINERGEENSGCLLELESLTESSS